MAPERPRGEQQGAEAGMGASSAPPSTPGVVPSGDTAFMEQVLRELSAQNEHARGERAGDPSAAPEGVAPRPRTVRVPRDSEFRTPEGVPSARAYLPARTLAPGRKEPIDPDRVRVADPRKLPTVRISRDRRDPSRKDPAGASSQDDPTSAPEPELDWGSPVPEETAPTLRSASPLAASARRSGTRQWVGWAVLVAAVAGALLVALAARIRASGERTLSPAASPSDGRSATLGPASALRPAPPGALTTPPAVVTSSPAVSSSPSSSPAVSEPGTPEPAARPRAAPKSDRWY